MSKTFITEVEIPEFVMIPTSELFSDWEIVRVARVFSGNMHVVLEDDKIYICATYTILKHAIVEPTTSDWIRHAEHLGYEVS